MMYNRPASLPRLLGILTYSRGRGHADESKPFGHQTGRFRRLCLACQRAGVFAFVFSPEQIDWNSMTIMGTTAGRQGKWDTSLYSIPDAVYNRIPTRSGERDKVSVKAFGEFRRLGIPVFNTRFLSKPEVYGVIEDDLELAVHLPKTERLVSAGQVERLLMDYGTVYMKRANGTLGNDTLRLNLLSDGTIGTAVALQQGVRRLTLSEDDLPELVARLVRRGGYMVQQGIDLAEIGGSPFDLRVLVQKKPSGRWGMTGVAARVAGPGQITTHVPRGGSRASFEDAIRMGFGSRGNSSDLLSSISRLCCKTAWLVEKRLGLHLCEASFDMGIDKNQYVWFIEMNSKPFIFDEASIERRATTTLAFYARSVIDARLRGGQGTDGDGPAEDLTSS